MWLIQNLIELFKLSLNVIVFKIAVTFQTINVINLINFFQKE